LGGGCSKSNDGGAGPTRLWSCFEGTDCSCRIVRPGSEINSSSPVDDCLDTSCCLLTQTSSADAGATCTCLTTFSDCDAEAKSRRNTAVVRQCPPPGEGPQGQCAVDGENCRHSYLEQNELSGCCEGSVCKVNSAGVPVCQAASDDELVYGKQCKAAQRSPEHYELELLTTSISTSAGDVTLPEVDDAYLSVGPGGCVLGLTIELGSGGCQIVLEVESQESGLVLTDVRGSLAACEGADTGASGSLDSNGEPLAALVALDTLTCDGGSFVESYCVAGNFEFRVDGLVGDVLFDDQRIVVSGGVCSSTLLTKCTAAAP
jgi:hypothetical protein